MCKQSALFPHLSHAVGLPAGSRFSLRVRPRRRFPTGWLGVPGGDWGVARSSLTNRQTRRCVERSPRPSAETSTRRPSFTGRKKAHVASRRAVTTLDAQHPPRQPPVALRYHVHPRDHPDVRRARLWRRARSRRPRRELRRRRAAQAFRRGRQGGQVRIARVPNPDRAPRASLARAETIAHDAN